MRDRRRLMISGLATALLLAGCTSAERARQQAVPTPTPSALPTLTVVAEAESTRSATLLPPATAAPVPGTSTVMSTPSTPASSTVRPTKDDPSPDSSASRWLVGALVLGLSTGGVIAWRRGRSGTGRRPVPPGRSRR